MLCCLLWLQFIAHCHIVTGRMRGQDGTEQDIADCGFISIHLPTDILCIWAEILICLQPEIRKINCKYICIVCASLPLCACVCRWLSQMISIWLSKSPAQMSLKFTAAAANYQRHFIILQSVNKCTHPLTHTHTHTNSFALSLWNTYTYTHLHGKDNASTAESANLLPSATSLMTTHLTPFS